MIGLAVASMLCEAAMNDQSPPASAGKPASVSEKVKLSDGREVEFVGKRKMLKESLFPETGLPQVRLDFRNGETRLFQIPEELLYRFAAHGAEQKLGDETAGETDIDDMVLAVDDLIERLKKLEWNVKREGGGMAGTSVLIKALVELSKKTDETVEAATERVKKFLSDKKPAEKTALRNSAKVKPIIDRLEAEKLAKAEKVDTDALLGQLA
jgi:hypothetical protein